MAVVRGKITTQALPQAFGMLDRVGGLKAREKGRNAAQGEEGRLKRDLDGHRSFCFLSTRWATLEKL